MYVYFSDGVLAYRIPIPPQPAFQSETLRLPIFRIIFSMRTIIITGIRPNQTIDGRIRRAFPRGHSAAWSFPFLVAVKSLKIGARFDRYPRNGGFHRALSEKLDPRMLQLLLDDSGTFLSHGHVLGSATEDFPHGVSFIVGGPKGFAPYVFETRNWRPLN